MKKETKTTAAANNNNNEIKEVMKMAEVKVEVKGNQEEVKTVKKNKVQKPRNTFKELILKRIDTKAKNLPDYSYDPIRETLAEALNELEILLVAHKYEEKIQKTTFRKLAKFSKEEIESYLKSIR